MMALDSSLWSGLKHLMTFIGKSLEFAFWADGEPNNMNNEDCVQIYQPLQGRWRDISCNSTDQVIMCERLLPIGKK